MVEQFFVVDLVVDVEAVPEVAADDDATESQCLHLAYIVDVHAAQRIHFLVDETIGGCLFQLLTCERGLLIGIGLAVVDRVQEHVVAVALGLFQLLNGVAGTRQVALVAYGRLRVGSVDVEAAQVELFFLVEVAVNANPIVIFILQQCQKPF